MPNMTDNERKPPDCIVCSWCQEVGVKLFTLRTSNGCKAFCSELCFSQCRRASFKKNKICDFCKHVRHTVNYVDFQDGEQQLQFCSNKCLSQYKMNIFCKETQAHLHLHPHLNDNSASKVVTNKVPNLITPELWLNDYKNGENESSPINSYKDSSDADSDADNEGSPPIVPHSIKRKLSEFSTQQTETNLFKAAKVKINMKHKNNKETKRHKHSNSSALSQSGNRLPINKNIQIKNEWFGREARDNMLQSFQSPPHIPIVGRFSPPTNSTIRGALVTPNQQHIPLMNENIVNLRTTAPPIHGIPSVGLSSQMFPRFAGNMVRPELLRPPLIHGNVFAGTPTMPNLSPAHMEMLMRMQNGLSGLRHPFPYPPHAPTNGHPFTAMTNMSVGAHHSGGQPLVHSSQSSVSTPITANASLLPPVTIMVPYPVPIPLPIPIPIPLLFPISNNNGPETNNKTNNTADDNNCGNGNNSCNNFLNLSNNSKIESVITKLVEKNKTKTFNNNYGDCYHRSNHQNNHNDNDSSNGDSSLDLTRKNNTNVMFKNTNNNEPKQQKSDSSTETSFPQNLIVSRNKRCVGPTITPNIDNGYRVQ